MHVSTPLAIKILTLVKQGIMLMRTASCSRHYLYIHAGLENYLQYLQ